MPEVRFQRDSVFWEFCLLRLDNNNSCFFCDQYAICIYFIVFALIYSQLWMGYLFYPGNVNFML